MEKDWLTRRVTVEEVEVENMTDGVVFGGRNADWLRLKSQMIADDELWEFSSPEDFWAHLCGRAGVSLVRDGEVIDSVVTLMN